MLKTVSSITNAIGALNFKGTWNAATNTPTIVSGVGVKGDYFVVGVAGSTTIDGISNWGVGDWIAYNGTVWQRVEGGADLNGVNLSASGTTTLNTLNTSGQVVFNDAGADVDFRVEGDSDANLLFVDASADDVGVGTNTPATKLHVKVGSNGDGLSIQRNSTTAADYAQLSFMVTTNDAGGSDAFIRGVRGSSAGNGFLTFFTASTERMLINSTGIVTMSAYGAGAATFSAAGVISSVSDETWKIKDGVPVDPDAMLQMLEPGYWYYNEEKAPTFGADRQLGFYAQNVNVAIGPEAAPTPEEGKPWGYYDRSVLAVTVMSLKNALNSIQELKAITDTQAQTISALETRIALLEGQ